MRVIPYDEVSIKARIGLREYAGFKTDAYCCNSDCKHFMQEDRFGCRMGGWAYVNQCDQSLTLDMTPFIKEAEEKEKLRQDERISNNLGAGI